MFRKAIRLRLAARIAIFAVLLGALMPTFGRALLAGGNMDAAWMEVCTAEGMIQMSIDGAGEDGGTAGLLEACAYCCPHAGAFGLPPVVLQGGPFAAREPDVHALYPVEAPYSLNPWAPLQPRAPPLPA
ncbi:DUF2946 domain-containing protein [Thauera linaloolentis]|uniref:DUF2946 domain-containing protein n=1 Tax=Thauera linaloolentis (strain DSM 12138 / JCM 21573 / CCUG 41526 / CIP 105981 / IAM 15112 / NBRC 102519 / 47Lol) TaxID=1123367 RepID=N6XZ23_THAL4|nr:DUF2946 domain-containing protein [Thauera linaloolentis]ENO87086.1 hypothetical protein C666_11735 [Thauera linaloolentis 47Lol = DSM 12138]MCM8565515.1 DUF2946 domain-containing protein [Thauera linaloolentis]